MSLLPRPVVLLVTGTLLTSLALVSAPARAGRASACKAPPFAVPTETQRAVDAAINARVTGTGSGGVSSTVETRTEYETVTLSQDAAARAWVEYTLCAKLAKKLISQDLHDELLRSLIAPAVATSLPVEATATPTSQTVPQPEQEHDAPITVDQIAGTWQVVSRFQWSTCPAPNNSYGTYAYTWLVGADDKGDLRVDVTGTTAFPGMTGRIQGDRLILEGARGGSASPTPVWTFSHPAGETSTLYSSATVDLALEGGMLKGTRDVILFRPLGSETATEPDAGVRLMPCQVRYEVQGTR